MVKYRISYFDVKNNGWRVELSNLSYLGNIINLNTTQSSGCTITYSGSDDPLETIISSSANFNVLKHSSGLVDVKELKNATDMDWSVDVYKNDMLFWTGYLVPDGIQEAYEALPYEISLTAVDGLKLLTGKRYVTNNWLLPSGIVQRSFISHVRDILFLGGQLGKPLPIRWVGDLKQNQDGVLKDAFTEKTYSPRGEGYTDFNGRRYSSYYILDNYLRALGSRIYQSGGKWVIERILDIRNGVYNWKEINTTFSPTEVPILTSGTQTIVRELGGSEFIVDTGAYTMNLPGVRNVITTYESNKSENSLPNGSFDAVLFEPSSWYPSIPDITVTTADSINGRDGASGDFAYPVNEGPSEGDVALRTGIAGALKGLPIDTATMFKRMSFGFTIMPINGFPFDTSTGIIDWTTGAFRFKVELTAHGNEDYVFALNENGFWIPKPDPTQPLSIVSISKYNGSNRSEVFIDIEFKGKPIVGDNILYSFQSTPRVQVFSPYEYSNNLAGFLNYAGQYMVDNSAGAVLSFGVAPLSGGIYKLSLRVNSYNLPEPTLKHPLSEYTIDLSLSNTYRDGYIAFLPEATKIGDVLQVNFDKYQGIKLPDFKGYPNVKFASINVFFNVKKGQRYKIDDVYVKLDENFEMYEYAYSQTKFTDTLDYELKISSSTNGFFTTNVMQDYSTSYAESKYTDSTGYTGTLTDLFSRTALRLRSKSLELFEGNVIGQGFTFGGLHTVVGLDGKKMLPLSAQINTESCETQLTCVELNLGDDSFQRSFYGSNDKPLSNEIIN